MGLNSGPVKFTGVAEGEAADCLKPQLPSMWYSDALEQTLRSN